jgi:hypothetical protein
MVSEEASRSRINDAVDRLAHEFRGKYSSETIHQFVAASFESYRGSRIADFVPILVYKSARDRFRSLTTAGGGLPPADPSS